MPGGIATGPAGGDLAGSTYPNPVVADSVITSRKAALTVSYIPIATEQSTTSTSYTDLATAGPAVTLTPGITQNHLLIYSVSSYMGGTGMSRASISLDGAAAINTDSSRVGTSTTVMGTGSHSHIETFASGATHTLKYLVSANEGYFSDRKLSGVCI